MNEIRTTAYGPLGREFLQGLQAQAAAMAVEQARWHDSIRAMGVSISHPDDGWVDRDTNTMTFAYPSLADEPPRVGALVALGHPGAWRLVRLVGEVPQIIGGPRWRFEKVTRENHGKEGTQP